MGFLPKILIIWAFAFNPQLVLQPLPRTPTAAPLTFTVSSVGPCTAWTSSGVSVGPQGGVCRVSGRPWLGFPVQPGAESLLLCPLPSHLLPVPQQAVGTVPVCLALTLLRALSRGTHSCPGHAWAPPVPPRLHGRM